MPILLFLMGAATLALVASQNTKKAPTSGAAGFALDPDLDPRLRAQVEGALQSETDPARLEAFATELGARYPYAAWYLRAKATGLRNMGYGVAAPALPAAAATPRGDGLDAHLPENLRFNVVELVTHGTDPAVLEAFAGQLGAYPLAASALRLRAAYLRSVGMGAPARPAPPGGVTPPLPAATPPGAPEKPAAPAFPPLPGLDPGMTPETAAKVATALLTENDPAKLRALASELSASCPTAATMLLGKANTLSPTQAPASPAPAGAAAEPPANPASSAPPVPVAPAPPAAPPPPPAVPEAPAAPAAPSLFDPGMSPEEQSRVMTALSSESNPAKLRELADALAPRYPKTALLLSNKAAAVSALFIPGSVPSLPSAMPAIPPIVLPPAPAAPASAPPPAAPAAPARTYKVKDGDFPIKIAKKFGKPESAWKELVTANPQKATRPDGNFKDLLPGELLNVPASWPDAPGEPAAPAQAAPAAPPPTTPPPAVPSSTSGLDPGLPVDVAKAVMTALATEKDPAKLRGFASSIMAQYPVAAGVLLAKANTLGLLVSSPAPAPAATPAKTAPSPARAPAPAPSGTVLASTTSDAGRSYRVQSGDSPSRIAKKLTGNDAKWPELVAANPQKLKAANGNFKTLHPGEVLKLPASWNVPTTTQGARTARA